MLGDRRATRRGAVQFKGAVSGGSMDCARCAVQGRCTASSGWARGAAGAAGVDRQQCRGCGAQAAWGLWGPGSVGAVGPRQCGGWGAQAVPRVPPQTCTGWGPRTPNRAVPSWHRAGRCLVSRGGDGCTITRQRGCPPAVPRCAPQPAAPRPRLWLPAAPPRPCCAALTARRSAP